MISPQPVPVTTKDRILDSAAKLFGKNGFDGTSLRDITAEAGVNLAAVNYHFQSKDALIDALIERRIAPINARRLEILDSLGPNPTLEGVLEAFLSPLLNSDMVKSVPLVARFMSNPLEFLDRVYKRHLVQTSARFQEALSGCVPEIPREDIFWRLHFSAGSMIHVLALSHVLPQMAGSETISNDREALVRRMVAFLAAGFRSPAVINTQKVHPVQEKTQ